MESFLLSLLSPVLIIIIGKYIDLKIERYKGKMEKEKKEKMAKEQEISTTMGLMKMGLLAILRDNILQSCRFYIDRGSIEPLYLENLAKMHESYKALGGNGLCDRQYEIVRALPLTGEEEK